jgi:hypothetical protein
MDEGDIEYLITELISTTHDITSGGYSDNQVQLLYIRRNMAIDRLLNMGDCKCHI